MISLNIEALKYTTIVTIIKLLRALLCSFLYQVNVSLITIFD
jgi:hypothetical protein